MFVSVCMYMVMLTMASVGGLLDPYYHVVLFYSFIHLFSHCFVCSVHPAVVHVHSTMSVMLRVSLATALLAVHV